MTVGDTRFTSSSKCVGDTQTLIMLQNTASGDLVVIIGETQLSFLHGEDTGLLYTVCRTHLE